MVTPAGGAVSVRRSPLAGAARASLWVCAIALPACAGAAGGGTHSPPPIEADAGPAPVRALYELGAAPMPFGAIPWPDDSYLDADGHVSVRDLPSGATREYAAALTAAMVDLDGFGLRPTIYFRFDGALDPSSVPADAGATLGATASVFLIDVDTASPQAFERIAVDVQYVPDGFELRLRPALPRALNPGRRYAAVVTRALSGADGRPVQGAERFLRVRDPDVPLFDSRERAARTEYAPVLETLASHGLARDKIAALAVFHVQSVRTDLMDARDLVLKSPAPAPVLTDARSAVELDSVLGTPPQGALGLDHGGPHDHIGWMIQGHFSSPNLLSTRLSVHGAFERTAGGALRAKRQDDVPFTLWLPLGSPGNGPVPVVIVQHGLGGDRSDALPLANALAASGYAVIAIDAPFHGLRSGQGDNQNRFTGRPGADGFGDAPGDFVGERDVAGDLPEFHPFYYRDAVRQGVVDLMSLVYVLNSGDWSGLAKAAVPLAQLKLDATTLPLVGTDLGAEMGLMLASLEPRIGGLVLAFAGGLGVDGWFESPAQRPLAEGLLSRLGYDPLRLNDGDPAALLMSPDLDAWRTLSDRATPLAYAPTLSRLPANLLMLMARDDEVVHNRGTEVLAYALGAEAVGGAPAYVSDLATDTIRPGATLSGNFMADGGTVTRVLYVLDPSGHDALTRATGSQQYQHPIAVPPEALQQPKDIDNPIAATLTQIGFFLESLRACAASMPTPSQASCAASVEAPPATP